MPVPVSEALFTADDFTFFRWDPVDEDFESWLRYEDNKRNPQGEATEHPPTLRDKDYEMALRLKDPKTGVAIDGRAVVCRTVTKAASGWSVTVRNTTDLSKAEKKKLQPIPNRGVSTTLKSLWALAKQEDPRFLNSQQMVASHLAKKILLDAPAQGLLAVFGATSSGKNWIARGLIHDYLVRKDVTNYYKNVRRRRPHLLTFEDPVEKFFWKRPQDLAGGLDYTPREKKHSADTLADVLKSALRQTPAAVYVGETRSSQDWRRVLDFAGTGHFIITTGHAGSLTEAMGTLLTAMKADTPARRKDVADRLIAVVHLTTDHITAKANPSARRMRMAVTLPAVWRATKRAKHALMAQGRGSILPEDDCFGRYTFANELIAASNASVSSRARSKFLCKALQMDLEGL